ncbi:hypothetical protein MRX96_054524 [Rhipicephalus microplus]
MPVPPLFLQRALYRAAASRLPRSKHAQKSTRAAVAFAIVHAPLTVPGPKSKAYFSNNRNGGCGSLLRPREQLSNASNSQRRSSFQTETHPHLHVNTQQLDAGHGGCRALRSDMTKCANCLLSAGGGEAQNAAMDYPGARFKRRTLETHPTRRGTWFFR